MTGECLQIRIFLTKSAKSRKNFKKDLIFLEKCDIIHYDDIVERKTGNLRSFACIWKGDILSL